ncbi:aldehyde dehydrogenase family protein [Streptomyces sp. NPDC060322]|uniref:aldehyde dehydrogenase family protein n=1 Tax=Streptomyces sp. NPDC060322 TaxID=3347097 RepID=UPI003651FF33
MSDQRRSAFATVIPAMGETLAEFPPIEGCADVERARRVAERVQTGTVRVSHPTSTQPDLPFGGIERSGYGRELSKLGMQEFVNRELVRILPPDAEPHGIAG